MRLRELTLDDFERVGEPGAPSRHYFRCFLRGAKGKYYEVCLESCMGGYCVAIYDEKQNLIGEKECTDMEGFLEYQLAPGLSLRAGEALTRAVEMANKKVKKLNLLRLFRDDSGHSEFTYNY